MIRFILGFAAILALPLSAKAGSCDHLTNQVGSLAEQKLVDNYTKLLSCDRNTAESSFVKYINTAAQTGDISTITKLSLSAIDAKAYLPVWKMLTGYKEYSVRDEVAAQIGEHCDSHEEVVPFLQGAYFGLDPIPFSQWDDALISCESEVLGKWIEDAVAKPPSSSFDEKYNTMISTFVKRRRAEALPALEIAAIQAAKGSGPYNDILEKMNQAVQPVEIGEDMSDENRNRLEKALINVANNAPPEKASLVADRLFAAGATTAAAGLLPRVYPDRVQDGNRLLYGVASIENCDNQAFIHWASVSEPSKRWSILADLEAPLRQYKPRLKCQTQGDWPIIATNEPVKDKNDVQDWIQNIQAEWENKSFEVKLKEEKAIQLN